MFRVFIFTIFSLAAIVNVFANTKLQVNLKWATGTEKIEVANNQFKNVLRFYGSTNTSKFDYLPVYSSEINLNTTSDLSFSLNNAIYEPVNENGIEYNRQLVQNDIQVQYAIHYNKKMPVATVYFIPLRKNNFGGLEKLVSAEITITITPKPQQRNSRSNVNWAANSVLSTGNWYKVAVPANGIYKIDYDFLNNLGINPANIDPRNIRIYGNGGGMLSEENASFRYGDLQENSIVVVGENDGRFDQGDYILFYGKGPNQWSYKSSSQSFEHEVNHYSDAYHYFITTSLGQGKRISTQPVSGTANTFSSSFDDFAFYEKDEYNFLQSGREWFGDIFNFSVNNRNYPFTFSNLDVSAPVKIRAAFAARSTSSQSTFIVNANGQSVLSESIVPVGNSYTNPYANEKTAITNFNSNTGNINLGVTFSNASSSAEGYINFLELNVRRNLTMTGDQLAFRDKNSVGAGKITQFNINGANNNLVILDITDPVDITAITPIFNGSTAQFSASTETLKEFVALYYGGNFPAPVAAGSVSNQNLHAIGQPDMLIVTSDNLYTSALSLANHHIQKNGFTVKTVKVNEIYNEFSSGTQDISAIRDFVRMVYDKAGSDTSLMPKYLLLFGDASYDYKDRISSNTNFVPTYESPNSLDPINSFNTDDYFGCLDESEGGSMVDNNDYLDIAIGRIPVKTPAEAQNIIAKIINYQSNSSLGNWRNEVTFIADDEDGNLHLKDAEAVATYVDTTYKAYNLNKIYFDSYQQVSIAGGSRYPDVKDAINRKIFSGTLIMNYIGHGGINGLAYERVLDATDVATWNNMDKLPLFVTATCELSKFDDPAITSVGEQILLKPNGGGIAMVTTLRLVFASANRTLNENFFKNIFEPLSNGNMPTMGEAITKVKNNILASSDDTNLRKFVLLGDPAVRLNYPSQNVVTASVSGIRSSTIQDTLRALSKVTITGEVQDKNGIRIDNFNGIVYPTVFDKKSVVQTLKNDSGSNITSFDVLRNILYRGKASVTNGTFSFTFVVPKDISYSYGKGKISYYADNGNYDAHGYDENITIGGTADSFLVDNNGPEIKIYMNDEKFAFGGITDESPVLLVKLEDENGINTVGTGIGHDITGVLDQTTQNTYVLNEYYSAALDDYTRGEIRYPLNRLPEGRRNIRVKAWDVYNNSSEGYTEFIVSKSADLALGHVLNYPNPFTTNTFFQFEHNKPGQPLFVQVKIFTVSGKLVKTIQQDILSESYRVDNIKWDGLDDFGDRIGRGVYVYKVDVRASDGANAHKFEKLVILK
jgi:hypothetical protein